jgi:uncharacterized RDD family membrane protein YckC
MNFYYAEGDQKVGPIGKEELQALVKTKKVNASTLVWRPGMEAWQELGKLIRSRKAKVKESGPKAPAVPIQKSVCAECGQMFAEDEMIQFQESWICAGCKPVFIQKIKEGVSVAGSMDLAGFWLRFGAWAIDAFIMGIVNLGIFIPMGMYMSTAPENPAAAFALMPLIMLLQYAIPAAYETWFVGKYGATPGKMACKLMVVVADGSRVTYLRSFGRYFAKLLSGMILCIGYIMAAFDEEKRTLHDRICETRVVRK